MTVRPTQDRFTNLSKRSVQGSIEAGIELIVTAATVKDWASLDGLRATIVPGLMPTLQEGLGSMMRVNFDHADIPGLCASEHAH